MIYKLLELGADPNISDYNGDTPLIKAIWSTNDSNADINQITNLVKELIKHGADVNAKNESGRTGKKSFFFNFN
jgi:ankyrin repeat protein